MSQDEKCPGCGADKIRDAQWNPAWDCESHEDRGLFCPTPTCLLRQVAQRDKTIKSLRESLNDMMLAVQTFHGKAGWQLYKKNAPEWQRAKAAFCEAATEANK